jgi:7,8-dihydropterin-6-yl-methyl-4-(beta-D-ribofuranosyl)aminobenzene 5'-phosphate synthase
MRVFLTLPDPPGQQDRAIWQLAMQDRTIVDFGETSGVRGVSVLSACSHAGVVNAALGAQGAFGGEPIDVILGGYHLAGEGMEPRIEPTVHDLANRVRPRVVVPGHCTGWRAKAALAHTFAPGNYGPSVVGSLYALRAT